MCVLSWSLWVRCMYNVLQTLTCVINLALSTFAFPIPYTVQANFISLQVFLLYPWVLALNSKTKHMMVIFLSSSLAIRLKQQVSHGSLPERGGYGVTEVQGLGARAHAESLYRDLAATKMCLDCAPSLPNLGYCCSLATITFLPGRLAKALPLGCLQFVSLRAAKLSLQGKTGSCQSSA